jgi:hypothetical protein
METSTEKRKSPRFKVNCPVSFICFDKLKLGEVVDLGPGGMKIESRYILFAGETYDFMVVIDGQAIPSRGKVVYSENRPEFTYGIGVSFLKIPEGIQSKLTAFLSACQS